MGPSFIVTGIAATLLLATALPAHGQDVAARVRLEQEAVQAIREGWPQPKAAVEPRLACSLPTPLPAAPPAGAYAATFSASWSSPGDTFQGTLWREPCAGAATATTLYLRITPTTGTPFICSSAFDVIQNNTQYSSVKLVTSTSGSSFCNDLLVPMTFAVDQYTFETPFDRNGAFTLVFDGASGKYPASFPAYSAAPVAYAPQPGLWWNAAESGSGYALDVKHNVLVMTVYSYTAAGSPLWYLAAGPIVNNVFTGTLDRYQGGQCIACGYKPTTLNGNDGAVTVTFTSSTSATLQLPGGRVVQIVPQPF